MEVSHIRRTGSVREERQQLNAKEILIHRLQHSLAPIIEKSIHVISTSMWRANTFDLTGIRSDRPTPCILLVVYL